MKIRQKNKGKGNPWWVFVSHNGTRMSRSVGTKKAAEKAAAEIEEQLGLRKFGVNPSGLVYSHWKRHSFTYQDSSGRFVVQPVDSVPFTHWYGMPCIYLLMQDQECVYVGQSINLPARLLAHMRDYKKTFNRVSYFEVPKEMLDTVERDIIKSLNPKCNNKHKRGNNHERNGGMSGMPEETVHEEQ